MQFYCLRGFSIVLVKFDLNLEIFWAVCEELIQNAKWQAQSKCKKESILKIRDIKLFSNYFKDLTAFENLKINEFQKFEF